ncbi:MAG: hypothetical protein JWP08_453, partial [Bryobacterales bacterium]|nr:hypothetical protein [Bryobacterales bacterium]
MPQFILGIDLGTTNSALAFTDTNAPDGEHPSVQLFR